MTNSIVKPLSNEELAQHVDDMDKFDSYFIQRQTSDETPIAVYRPSSIRQAFEEGRLQVFIGPTCMGHPNAPIEKEPCFDLNEGSFYRLAQLVMKLDDAVLSHENFDLFLPVTIPFAHESCSVILTKSARRDEKIPCLGIRILAARPMLDRQDDQLVSGTLLTITYEGRYLIDDNTVLEYMDVVEPRSMNLVILNPPKIPLQLGNHSRQTLMLPSGGS